MMIVGIVTAIFVVVSGVQSSAVLAKDESAVFAGVAQQMKLDAVQVQQWLSDISATRGQDGLDDGFDEAEKSYHSFLVGLSKFKEMYDEENDSLMFSYYDTEGILVYIEDGIATIVPEDGFIGIVSTFFKVNSNPDGAIKANLDTCSGAYRA